MWQGRTLRYLFVPAAAVLAACMRSPEEKSAAWINSARAANVRGDYGRAIVELQNAIQATPRDAEAHYQMGLALQGSGQVEKAFRLFKSAADLQPRHVEARLRMVELLAASGDPKVMGFAEEQARAALEQRPDNPEVLQTLADVESRRGKTQDAVEHLQKALNKDPAHLKSAMTLAYIQWSDQHDGALAERTLRAAIARLNNSAESVVALGRLYALMGRQDAAEAQFRQAGEKDPQYGPALLELAKSQVRRGQSGEAEQTFSRLSSLPDKYYRAVHAVFLFQNGERGAAIAELQKLRAQNPEDSELRRQLVEFYLQTDRLTEAEKELGEALGRNPRDAGALEQSAQLRLRQKRYQEAEKTAGDALRLQPESASGHYLRAQALRGLGRLFDERQELQFALQANPSLLQARLDLSRNLRTAKSAGDSLAVVDEAPAGQKQDPALLEERVWVLFAQGRFADAKADVERALSLSRRPPVLVQAGLLALQEKRNAAGRTLLEEALRAEPASDEALNAIALSYASEGNKAAALERVRKQAARMPKSAPVQLMLGNWLERNGDISAARSAYAASLEADPSYPPAVISAARMEMLEGRWDAAKRRLEVLLASEPRNTKALLARAMAEEGSGQYEAAIQTYRSILRLDPAHLVAKNNLVVRLSQNPATADEAVIHALDLKRSAPDDAEVDDTVGWAYYQKGSYDRAIKYLSGAAARSKSARIRYHLAMAYFRGGDRGLGEKTLAAARSLNPNLPEAEQARRIAASVP
jgi:tetratricopeptide (TPR) repeat protein